MESDDGDIIEDFKKLKVENLKRILLENGEPTTGKKADLVLRCEVLAKRKELQSSQNEVYQASATPSQDIRDTRTGEITFKVIAKEAEACEWSTDLRHLPSLSFVQLYDYLVVVTSQFDHEQFKKSGGFKKLKSFKFFKEGHLKDMSCGTLRERTYVKCQVLASMKKQRYNVIVSFDKNGNVLKAACECVAGKGVYGFGKCNHVGGMLFAIEDFCRQGLKNNPQPVSCTSKLCQWNVPRNLKVDPKPVDDILIVKHQYGKESANCAKNSLYDPRAPSDREMNNESLQQFCSTLASCLKSSSFFLFYDLQPSADGDDNIVIDSICEPVPIDTRDVETIIIADGDNNHNECNNLIEDEICIDLPFSDDYDISSEPFKEMLDIYKESITDEEIERVEIETRGQSNNVVWKELKRKKLTASNFKAVAIRQKEPDKLLKTIMYIKDNKKPVKSLLYGNENEDTAVQCYITLKKLEGNVNLKVEEVGTILSKEKPGLGASLDRKVLDPLANGMKLGGLEVKCPFSKRGMTVEQACEDKSWYLSRVNGGRITLKSDHQYYYQIQGQMFVCKLQWVDFVVWFGIGNLFVERIFFNSRWWYKQILPRLDFFYRRAFLPEVLTRRVERGVRLYKHGGWECYQSFAKRKAI